MISSAVGGYMDELRAAQDFLEICKLRFSEAQRRFQSAHQNLQRAQQEFAAAQLQHNNWQGVVLAETARVAQMQQAARANQSVLPMVVTQPPQPEPQQSAPDVLSKQPLPQGSADQSRAEVNKTELVRELLSQHQEGMTPAQIWAVLKNDIPRNYVYSILKRLKDADEVIYQRRRKKYSLRVAPKHEEEPKEQPSLVH